MDKTRKSSVVLPMVLNGYSNTIAPAMPTPEEYSWREEIPTSQNLTTQAARPLSRSRENSCQGSSRPTSRPSTPQTTRTRSHYPDGDFRNSSIADLVELKTDVMCNWLHQQQVEKMWYSSDRGEGVMVKKARDDYMCCPKDLQVERGGLFDAIRKLKVKVLFSKPASVLD